MGKHKQSRHQFGRLNLRVCSWTQTEGGTLSRSLVGSPRVVVGKGKPLSRSTSTPGWGEVKFGVVKVGGGTCGGVICTGTWLVPFRALWIGLVESTRSGADGTSSLASFIAVTVVIVVTV